MLSQLQLPPSKLHRTKRHNLTAVPHDIMFETWIVLLNGDSVASIHTRRSNLDSHVHRLVAYMDDASALCVGVVSFEDDEEPPVGDLLPYIQQALRHERPSYVEQAKARDLKHRYAL